MITRSAKRAEQQINEDLQESDGQGLDSQINNENEQDEMADQTQVQRSNSPIQDLVTPNTSPTKKSKKGKVDGHESDDPLAGQPEIEKFSGDGDVEEWVRYILAEFDKFKLSINKRYKSISSLLIGDARMWYFKNKRHMPTFDDVIQGILERYGKGERNQEPPSRPLQDQAMQQQLEVMESLKTQMIINSLEKLQKFSGRSKQNVSKWLSETERTMNTFKLTDSEKLSLVPTCLEADAREWFYDQSIHTWTSFVLKILTTFESSGKADISFNRLRNYKQGLNQDVRQYYFEIMKLCKEVNFVMNDNTKLQYLKDGLKPSLRFDVLLKNPANTEEFLAYAQKVEELKSLDERMNTQDSNIQQKSNEPTSVSTNTREIKSTNNVRTNNFQQTNQQSNQQSQQTNQQSNQQSQQTTPVTFERQGPPKRTYACYQCGDPSHFYRNCPHFREWSH